MSAEIGSTGFGVGPPSAIRMADGAPSDRSPQVTLFLLALAQAIALAIQAVAVSITRTGSEPAAQVLSAISFGVTYASAFAVLIRPHVPRSVRNAAVVCLAVVPMLQLRLIAPLNMASLDEQIHLRTLRDMISSHGLFHDNPYLPLGARYPGFEALTVAFHQIGIPAAAAALIVILLSRLLLVFVLYDSVVYLTRNTRAGALAVAVYCWAPHYVFWLTQYAYVTLALPLALAAIALIARARRDERSPQLLLAGAAVCLAAMAVTHHVTAMATTAFLALWALAERGKPGSRVLYGALIAAAATAAWNLPNQAMLSKYLGSTADGIWDTAFTGLRKPYSNEAAYFPPLWERALLYYWTAAIVLVCATVSFVGIRSLLRRFRAGGWRSVPRTELLLVAMAAAIPPVIAARALPRGGLVSDRMLDFLFFPLALLAASGAVRLFRARPYHLRRFFRLSAAVLAAGVFVGAHLLSLPGWARLPGTYLPSADVRSMDPETLAAVRWAGEALPPGSHIAADRTPAVLLASEAGLYPRFWKNDDEGVHSLYFAEEWGADEERIARSLDLRFLYVDRRLAEAKPLVGVYFFIGEQEGASRLSAGQVRKFEEVPGIRELYRHGPVSIYDLSDLGMGKTRSGWFGEPRSTTPLTQLLLGLSVGVLIATTARSRYGAYLARRCRAFATTAGATLTAATVVAAACITWVALLSVHVWLTPVALLTASLIVLLANPSWVRRAVRFRRGAAEAPADQPVTSVAPRSTARSVSVLWVLAWSAVACLTASAITLAVRSAWVNDISQVDQVLDDPSAIQCAPEASASVDPCPG